MRDLQADWRKWTATERILGVLVLAGFAVGAAFPYLVAG